MKKHAALMGLLLSGCMNSPDIKNNNLNDRVKAILIIS